MDQNERYYEENADSFFEDTVSVDMSDLHERFLAMIDVGGHILDAGCGSGRDAKAFLGRGYQVTAFDACASLAHLASVHLGQSVAVRSFVDVTELAIYDGIWACASLLHVPREDIPDALARLWAALKPGGVLYCSFKVGSGERDHLGRRFTDADEIQFSAWLESLYGVADCHFWRTLDQRPGRTEEWLNGLVTRVPAALVTGGETNHFLPHLCAAINTSSEIDLAVAFTKSTGLRLLLPDLLAALTGDGEATAESRNGTANFEPAQVRILTSDYLDVTDPEALRRLMLLQEQGAEVRIYESAGSSFHMKAYLFARTTADGKLHGQAFIGSSNISRQALTNGLEWNFRIDYPKDAGFLEARSQFEQLFVNPRAKPLTDAWIDAYEQRRIAPPRPIAPGSNEVELPPTPTQVQVDALQALAKTREAGYQRGLVVLATGLGKTWLSAFDAQQFGARRVLFVAHREEILNQAAETFLRIRPSIRVGFYQGKQRDILVDVLCASVQTLGRAAHLERFAPQHFDYIVVDEFHHAAAPTYHRLLKHFVPTFLLGLTATPDRTDQSDILSLCDDNLVFTSNLFSGIENDLLAPFHYFGVFDEGVDYEEIPWRNGRFDPSQLANKLATLARAKHVLKHFQQHAQSRTLAFCVSISHAEFMAEYFVRQGTVAAAVYGGSRWSRGAALEQLADGRLQVIFSVDLFNEGVDLPGIDTVLMLRPTESKILFLQQLGRGLRKAPGKDKLVVLDFIGNHHSFLHKPQALMGQSMTHRQLAEYARNAQSHQLELPDGCFINYDLQLIDFLKSLDGEGVEKDYQSLRDALSRRPTLAEYFRSGASVKKARDQFGDWFSLVDAMGDLADAERELLSGQRSFIRELETSPMTKSYKMVLLEAFQELDGWVKPPTLTDLAERSWKVLQRRRALLADLPADFSPATTKTPAGWLSYWMKNPIKAWLGGNTQTDTKVFFAKRDEQFVPLFKVEADQCECFAEMVQELVNYRLAAYEVRSSATVTAITSPHPAKQQGTELPFFPDLKIACGHFKSGRADNEEFRVLGSGYGHIDPARHFIARASGNSMNGGKQAIRNGDFLLLEQVNPDRAGSITGNVMAIERQDDSGDNQYLLRVVLKQPDGSYLLRANNPEYADIPVTEELTEQLRTFARLKAVLSPLEMALGQRLMREDIPELFGTKFNPGNWQSGHVVLPESNSHVLLVTLNKQGRAVEHRYLDHWIDEHSFHWQSQSATTPLSRKGQQIIGHEAQKIDIHLFVREQKLENGKASPFTYYGPVRYRSHTGSAPMSVVFDLVAAS